MAGEHAECFICDKHQRGEAAQGGVLFEDDLVYVGHVIGRLAGEAHLKSSPPLDGERHPEGDELLYLVAGSIDIALDRDDGEDTFALAPGQAFVVPQGVWHCVVVHQPSQLLFFTPGTSETRPRARSSAPNVATPTRSSLPDVDHLADQIT